jgi:hypothetical protein
MEAAGIIIVVLLVRVVLGAVASAIASSKGRSTVGWFFGGFFLDVIGIVIVAVLPNLKEQERRQAHAMSERRRLREQLRQEKMKTESFRQHAAGRLDAHDHMLGVDTRESPALAGPAPSPQLSAGIGVAGGPGTTPRVIPKARTSQPEPTPDNNKLWYYAAGGESRGPVPFPALRSMVERGEVTAATLVWSEGQTDWLPASQIGVLQAFFLA